MYSPTGDLVRSTGTFLGLAMNNIIEYNVVIGLLTNSLSMDVIQIMVYLDLGLVVSQLNRFYTILSPLLLQLLQRFQLLERSIEFISYKHIPRHLNVVVDSLTNYILYWYITHI